MIVILGASGYIGTAFRRLLESQGVAYKPLPRSEVDCSRPELLRKILLDRGATFLINCAGYTGKPNVDACERHKAECLFGNAVLPGMIEQACSMASIPWGHVSSGCIYTGARVDGSGFQETDRPNFSFRTNNCSFYSGTKALGEECLQDAESCFIWRPRMPFNHLDSERNYLSKLMRYSTLLDATNSISQLDEFVLACWRCWVDRVPFGIYNVVNAGAITTREIVDLIKEELRIERSFNFFESEDQFMQNAAITPRSNCILDNRKLIDCGIKMSDVRDSIRMSLRKWEVDFRG